MKYRRKIKDNLIKFVTYLASLFSVMILGSILMFVFIEGSPLLTKDIIFGNNENKADISMEIEKVNQNTIFYYEVKEGEFFSNRYGVALKDSKNLEGEATITITYVDANSPFRRAKGKGNYQGQVFEIKQGDILFGVGLTAWSDDYPNVTDSLPTQINKGAKHLAEILDQTYYISNITPMTLGGGIRGSIISTIYLILMTLVIALPIGVGAALYIHEIAPQNRITNLLRSLIDMLTGVPSIIYGLMGAALFIPLSKAIFGDLIQGGNLISGSLTLSVIVLPVIIKATESALDVVPKDYKLASLALGADETQTIFKVILPNAIPGILSATLLAVGRVMGESAALIYAVGTAVKDDIKITDNGTSLAVHIWSAMSGELPNFALASTISIILLSVVLSLNLIVKVISKMFMKKYS